MSSIVSALSGRGIQVANNALAREDLEDLEAEQDMGAATNMSLLSKSIKTSAKPGTVVKRSIFDGVVRVRLARWRRM